MDGTNTPITTLPHEIIENILSRIPVKYLLRFRSVSKKWNSTISDPTFAEIHLQQSKNSSSRILLAWEERRDFQGFHVTKIKNNKFRLVSVIEHPWEEDEEEDFVPRYVIYCYCDGLYLKKSDNDEQTYFLWNPSTKTYKTLHCPYPLDDKHNHIVYAICYDSLMKDYKIVIADMRNYAIFSCRMNKWSEVKEMEDYSWGYRSWSQNELSFNGSYYWVLRNEDYDRFEIIRFDCGDEKFKKVAKPEFEVKGYDSLHVTPFGGHLCLFVNRVDGLDMNMTIMKKIDEEDSWTELKVVALQIYSASYRSFVCLINENEIIIEVGKRLHYVLYDLSKNTFAKILKYRKYSNPISYVENLLLL